MKDALVTRNVRGKVRQDIEEAIGYFENHLPKNNYARFRKRMPADPGVPYDWVGGYQADMP